MGPPLKDYAKELDDAVTEMGGQPGGSLAKERTAYATLWFGPSTGTAFWSLVVMAHTLRQHDRERELVVITPTPSAVGTEPGFAMLQSRAAPLTYWQVAPLSAEDSASQACQASIKGTRDDRARASVKVWTKLHVWNLTRFDRVLYIDTDAMVLHPVDALWQMDITARRLFFAAHTLTPASRGYQNENATSGWTGEPRCDKAFPKAQWNAGILLLRPNATIMEHIMRAMTNPHLQYDCQNMDQPFFNLLLRFYGRCLPSTFNCFHPAVTLAPTAKQALDMVGKARCYPGGEQLRLEVPSTWEPRILHFGGGHLKPW